MIHWYLEKARNLPVSQWPGWIIGGIVERLAPRIRALSKFSDRNAAQQKAESELRIAFGSLDGAFPILRKRLEESFLLTWEDKNRCTSDFLSFFGHESIEDITGAAEDVVAHRFDFLGSGPQQLGKYPDWVSDIRTGRRWPIFKTGDVPIAYPDESDIRRVWELSRFQWAITLGQAYWFTGDEKFVREFVGTCPSLVGH